MQGNSCGGGFSPCHKLLMLPLQIPKPSSRKAQKKGTFWGIEVAETLQWRGWELGKEVIKHLVLKNVHEKPQKLSYRWVGSLLLLFLLTLSLHLPPSAPSIASAPAQILSPWAMHCRLCARWRSRAETHQFRCTALVPSRSI